MPKQFTVQAQNPASKQNQEPKQKRANDIDADLPDRIGRYKTREVLGVGGFGVVVSALDDALGSSVAIKILGSVHAADPDIRKRFTDEARLLRNVRSDHLITIHDIGELDDGRPFFVMDLADRGTFGDRLGVGRGSGIDVVSLQAVVTALTESLSALHAAGYVHRDVSPGNLLIQSRTSTTHETDSEPATVVRAGLVGSDERLLLGDLGLAKDVVGESQVTIIGGTPRFSSPEQVDPQGEVGPGTDVYGATAVIWRVVTGELPPEYHKLEESLDNIGSQWHAFMLRGMAPTIEQRFPNMQAWQSAAMAAFDVHTSHGLSVPGDRYSADKCPYQGLAAFQTQDADRFYGRDEMVNDLVERLRRHRVLVVGGASGSGKSSLTRAGLIPAIRSGALTDSARWPVLLFTPGGDPLAELQYQLRKTLDSLHVATSSSDQNPADDTRWRRMAEKITDVTGGMVICIDQFEELFTFDHDHATLMRVFDAFSSMSDPSMSLVRLVFVIRADFYASSSRYQWLAEAITQSQVLVGPMSKAELHKAITEPARLAKLRLDDDLVATILEEVGTTAGTLPLVSHALAESWKLRDGNRLTLENYRSTGGMFGAIGQSAETLYTQEFNSEEQSTARRLLLRLINPGEGVPDTRRPFLVADLQEASDHSVMQKVKDNLVEARLLTIDNDIIQLAHEAIIMSWHRLRDWINESRDDLRFQHRIERVAAEWDEAGRDPDLLYHGTPLVSALEWFYAHRDTANILEAEFLSAAEEAEKQTLLRKQTAAKRAKRNRRWAFSALLFLLIASLISSVLAFSAYQRSRSNEIAANFRLAQSLASQASDLSDRNPRLALALAAEVIERQAIAPVDARAALVSSAAALESSAYSPFASLVVGDVITIAAHPSQDLVVTGYRDGSVGFWNSAGVSLGEPVLAHGSAIEEFAFSPDGTRMVSVGLDGTMMDWKFDNVATIPVPKLAMDLGSLLWSIAFSPDGEKLAIATENGTVRLFRASDFKELFVLEEFEHDFLTVQFSPDSQRLFAGNGSGQVWSWSTSNGEMHSTPFQAHESDVWEIVFYPDGSNFVTASSDGRVRIWDVDTLLEAHEPFEGIAENVRGVQIDAQGHLIAGDEKGRLLVWDTHSFEFLGASVAHHDSQIIDSATQDKRSIIVTLGMDQVMRIWRSSALKSYLPLAIHEKGAYGLAISQDASTIATGDGSGRVRLFSAASGASLGVPLTLSENRVWAVAFDAAGELLAAADKEGTLAIWDVETGRRLARTTQAHVGSISTLVFNSENNTLLSGGADGTVRSWDVASLSSLEPTLQGHAGGVSRFSLSPDGSTLVAADRTGGIKIWNYAAAEVKQQWQADDNTIWSVAWSPDGKTLATAHADEFVRLWDAATGAPLRELTPHPGGATDVAFLSDGVTVVTTSRNGTIRLWDRELGLRLGEAIEKPDAPMWRVVGSHTGNWFATTSASGVVKVWNTLNEQVICKQAAWDAEAQRRYLGAGEQPLACQH